MDLKSSVGIWYPFIEDVRVKVGPIPSRFVQSFIRGTEEQGQNLLRDLERVFYACLLDWEGVGDEDGNPLRLTDEIKRHLFQSGWKDLPLWVLQRSIEVFSQTNQPIPTLAQRVEIAPDIERPLCPNPPPESPIEEKSFLIVTPSFDGEAHCRAEFLKSLEGLRVPPKTDLIFIVDSESEQTIQDFRGWIEDHGRKFRSAEVLQIQVDLSGYTFEKFLSEFNQKYPEGAFFPEIFGPKKVNPEELHALNVKYKILAQKRELGRRVAVRAEGYDFAFFLDSSYIVEPETLFKLYEMNMEIATAMPGAGDKIVGQEGNVGGGFVLFFNKNGVRREEILKSVKLVAGDEFFFKGKKLRLYSLLAPMNMARGPILHCSAGILGCLLCSKKVLRLTSFDYMEICPMRGTDADISFFLPLHLAGVREIALSTTIEVEQRRSERVRKKIEKFGEEYKAELFQRWGVQ